MLIPSKSQKARALYTHRLPFFGLLLFCMLSSAALTLAQDSRSLTPLQFAIQEQQLRLSSGDTEERRDALMRLSALHHPAASRAAAAALQDVSPTVRVAATNAVLGLPPDEAALALLPLLKDKDEFVRQETSYALGKTGSRLAVGPLLDLLKVEKLSGPKGAAVVALGQLGDETAVVQLSQMLSPAGKARSEPNEFVLRAAARSLGQIGSRAAVPALVSVFSNERVPVDTKREAAIALGRIGDHSASSTLQNLVGDPDPYLAQAAQEALRQIAQKRDSSP